MLGTTPFSYEYVVAVGAFRGTSIFVCRSGIEPCRSCHLQMVHCCALCEVCTAVHCVKCALLYTTAFLSGTWYYTVLLYGIVQRYVGKIGFKWRATRSCKASTNKQAYQSKEALLITALKYWTWRPGPLHGPKRQTGIIGAIYGISI